MISRDEAIAGVRELRSTLDYPIIDGDGHLIENFTLLVDVIDRLFGLAAVEKFVTCLQTDPMVSTGDSSTQDPRGPWWGISNDVDDVATAAIPGEFAARMHELGLDFAIMYPTLGLGFPTIADDEVRLIACRSLNVMNADLAREHADVMTVAAVIPMHTPQEALAELEHSVTELGVKVVMLSPGVARPVPAHPDAFPAAHWVDRYGLDSAYDYDPVWEYVTKHRLAVSMHGGVGYRYLPPAQRSTTNYVANHVLGHASLLIEVAKSLILGGVYHRFPTLHLAYLEGGAGWAVDMMHSLVEHFEKRSPEGLELLDPRRLDVDELTRRYKAAGMPTSDPSRGLMSSGEAIEGAGNEFSASGLTDEDDVVDLFRRSIFVGCEGDDRSVRRAFDTVGNLDGVNLGAFFSSDIGHWDVPRLAGVLLHSRALVEAGAMSEDDYRAFTFSNPVRFHAGANPDFFAGTVVQDAVVAERARLGLP